MSMVFFWQTLWNLSENADLKTARKNPNVLMEGDVVHIPDITLKEESRPTEQSHRFTLKGVPAKLHLRILEQSIQEVEAPKRPDFVYEPSPWDQQFDGVDQARPAQPQFSYKPRANAPYQLWVDGAVTRGQTKSDGLIECKIAPNAQKAKLVLDPGTPKESVVQLNLGHLDPVGELSGVQARLNNLGFVSGPVDGVLGPQSGEALKAFQTSAGLEATGEVDERTRQKLLERHESI